LFSIGKWSYFYSHYDYITCPENTNIGEKRINKKRERHTPLKSPLNGGIYSTIPLLGGVPFTAGRVLFIRHPEDSFFEAVRVSSFNLFLCKYL